MSYMTNGRVLMAVRQVTGGVASAPNRLAMA